MSERAQARCGGCGAPPRDPYAWYCEYCGSAWAQPVIPAGFVPSDMTIYPGKIWLLDEMTEVVQMRTGVFSVNHGTRSTGPR